MKNINKHIKETNAPVANRREQGEDGWYRLNSKPTTWWNYISKVFPDYLSGFRLRLHFLCSILALPFSIYLYWIIIAVLPTTLSMTTISGTLADSKSYTYAYLSGGHRGGGYTATLAFLKLDNYESPISASGMSQFFRYNKISIGDTVEVWIWKKDLAKLNQYTLNKHWSQYKDVDCEELSNAKMPRFYGLKINGKEIITPQSVLYNRGGGWLRIILGFVLFFFWVICFLSIAIGYKMIKEEKIKSKGQKTKRKNR
jgi:hypothetical protein